LLPNYIVPYFDTGIKHIKTTTKHSYIQRNREGIWYKEAREKGISIIHIPVKDFSAHIDNIQNLARIPVDN